MPTAKGSQLQFVIAEESTYGETISSPTGYKLPVSSISGDVMRQNLLENPEIRGNRNPAAPVLGNVAVSYNIECPLHLDAIGWIQKHGIGTPATSGSDPYTHISKVGFSGASAGSLPTGLNTEIGFTDITKYLRMTGCKVNTVGVNVTSEGVTTFNVGIVGQDFAANTSPMAASPTAYTSDALSNFAASIQEGGSPIAYVQSVDLQLNNNIDTSLYTVGGSGLVAEMPEGIAMVSGTVTALFQDLTLLTKAIDNTETSLLLTWTSGSYSLAISVPELMYEPKAPSAQGDRGVLVSLPFKAYYANGADATSMKWTLVNTVASY